MKILHVSAEHPDQYVGGRGIYLKNLIDQQLKFGHEVEIVSWPEFFNWSPTQPSESFFALNESVILESIPKLRDRKFDVIHGHDSDLGQAMLILKEILRIPLVFTIHLSATFTVQLLHLIYENLLVQKADALIACSEYYSDFLKEKHSIGTFNVIHNGVDGTAFGIAGKDLADNGRKRIFYCGRIAASKGLNLIAEQIESLLDYDIYIAGELRDTPLSKILYELQEKYPENVYLLGKLTHDQIGAVSKQCHAWIVPSIHAPFELVAIEAWACGVPLICSPVGAMKSYTVDGVDAIHMNGKIRPAVERAIEMSDHLIMNGKRRLPEFSWEECAKKTLRVYEDVTERMAVGN